MAWIEVGPLNDLPDGCGAAFTLGGRRVAIFRAGDEVFAIGDRCPHRGFPLHDGSFDGSVVRCRTHGSTFDLRTGAVRRGPASSGVAAFRVEVADGIVRVEVPD